MNEPARFPRRILSAAEYVLALHSPEDRAAVLVRNRTRAQTMQRILAAEAIASPPLLYWLLEQNQRGADIFLRMNPIKEHCFNRTKKNIREIRHVYLDLDEDGPASLQAIRTIADIPTPNFVLDTSAKKNQVIWRVEGLDQAHAESLLRSLATLFRGDPAATDISRVFRVPGFANRKYSDQFLVSALQQTDRIYQLRDFAAYEGSPDTSRNMEHSASARRMPLGHRSQSEADWAYAKRALARGDSPEEVIHRIADYRADDKADPNYYARRTVQQARVANRPEPSASGISEALAADKGPDH